MNFERFEFKELEIDSYQVKDVLRCLVHSILFNRALGAFQPKDMECKEIENVGYAKVDDANVDERVETGIDRFASAWTKSGSTKGNVCVGFYEKSVKKNFFGFGAKEEKMFWERWIIPLSFPSPLESSKPKTLAEKEKVQERRQRRLVENLLYLVSCINEKKDHIPPMKSNTAVALAFSFEISFTTGEKADESWGFNTLKRLLKQGPPMLLS